MDFAKLNALIAKKKQALKSTPKTIKPKPGVNEYVILPPWEGSESFFHDFGQHFIKDGAGQLKAVYLCTNRTYGHACKVCDGLSEAAPMGAANPETAKVLKEAGAAQNFLVGVLELKGETPDVPQVLGLGKNAFEQLISLLSGGWAEAVFDPTQPLIVTIERTGSTAKDTRYTVQASPRKHTLKKKVTPVNLDEFVAQESEEQENRALLAVKAVVGLPAPASSGAARLPAPNRAPADDEFTDVPDLGSTKIVSKTATVSAREVPLSTDMDDLLDGIDLDDLN